MDNMKKQIFTFLLGGLTFLCIGAGVATSTDILTVKPALPKSVIVKSFNFDSEMQESIIKYSRLGYIVKVAHQDVSHGSPFLVMEKY